MICESAELMAMVCLGTRLLQRCWRMQSEFFMGALHLALRKLASYSFHKFYQESEIEVVKYMSSVWNGNVNDITMQPESVVLTTPVSPFHRLPSACSCDDLSL